MKIFLITLFIATLSGMGVGGGGLLVIYLTLFEDTPQLIAQGTNLCFFIISALASTIYNIKKGKIAWKTTLIMSGAGVVTTFVGSLVAGAIEPGLLQKIFGGMLVLGGIYSLLGTFKRKSPKA